MAPKSGKKSKKNAARQAKNSPERKELAIRKRSELAEIEEKNTLPAEAPAPEKAEPVKATEKAEPVKATEKAEPVKEEPVKEEKPKKAEPKAEAKKEEAKKEEAKKEEPKKPAAKRTAKKEAGKLTVTNYFEIGEEQLSVEDVVKRIQVNYEEEGHKLSEIKDLKVYYNFGDRRAYYVINDNPEGSVPF